MKWERRDKKLRARKNKMKKHGKGIGQIYSDIIDKKTRDLEAKRKIIKEIDEFAVVASQQKLPKYGYGRPSNENFSSFVPEMKEFNLLKSDIRHYIKEGEKAPKGSYIQRGKRGGKFYVSGRKETMYSTSTKLKREEMKSTENRVYDVFKLLPKKIWEDCEVGVYPEKKILSMADIVPKGRKSLDGIYAIDKDLIFIDEDILKRSQEDAMYSIKKDYNNEFIGNLFEIALLHEIGHRVMHKIVGDKKWHDISRDTKGIAVTRYGKTNSSERFAEAFLYFLKNPKLLKQRDPVAHQTLRKYVFGDEYNKYYGIFQKQEDIIPLGSYWVDSGLYDEDKINRIMQKEFRTEMKSYPVGMCTDFARDFTSKIPESKIYLVGNPNNYGDFHIFTEHKGKYYDESNPSGTNMKNILVNRKWAQKLPVKEISRKRLNIIHGVDKLVHKEFGTIASEGFTPTFNYSGENKKKKIIDAISKLHETKIDEIEGEAEEKEPQTKLQEKILGDVENFEEKLVKGFINEYERMAILSKEYSNEDLGQLFILAKSVNKRKLFNLAEPKEINRLEQVIFCDAIAHNLHKQKFSNGNSIYRQLDEIADVSKSIGEIERIDRILVLQSMQNVKKIEDYMHIDVLQKGSLLEKSKSLWRLLEKAIKIGVEKLSNREIILLREWIYSKI